MHDYLEQAQQLRQAGQPFVLATVVRVEKPTSAKPGAKAIITADGALRGWVGGSCAEPTVIREALRVLRQGEPVLLRLSPPDRLNGQAPPGVRETALTCVSGGTLDIYLEPHLTEPQLVVVSHQPIAAAFAAMGAALGYAVTVVGLGVTAAQAPGARRVLADLAFEQVALTTPTYIVVASHGNYDEEALAWALGTEAAYVALVASPKRAAEVRDYLRGSGLSAAQLARLKAPAGLNLGAVTPEEIALSILAETVQLRRQGELARAAAARPAAPLPSISLPLPMMSDMPSAEVGAGAGLVAIDPVCGMEVEIAGARYTTEHAGATIYFCCMGCKRKFEAEPMKYGRQSAVGRKQKAEGREQ